MDDDDSRNVSSNVRQKRTKMLSKMQQPQKSHQAQQPIEHICHFYELQWNAHDGYIQSH